MFGSAAWADSLLIPAGLCQTVLQREVIFADFVKVTLLNELVSSISLPLRPKGHNGLILAPWSGVPNQSMVGGPPSHSAIKRGWGPRFAVRGSPRRRTPHPTNPNRPEGALERREAPPPPPPRPSSWIRRTRCHRPTLDRIVRDTVVPEPALQPLRQAAAAPATSTREMASDSALPSNPDGPSPLFPLCYLISCIRCSSSRSRCSCCLSVILKYIPE
jgi:hypothetical protein